MPIKFIQSDFRGGMNIFDEDINLGPTEYGLAFNIRNKTSAFSPIKEPLRDSSAPSGTKQGIYAFDKFVVLFNDGRAYYKNILTNSDWINIDDFSMNSNAPRIYAEPVPKSTFNYIRKLKDSNQISGTSSDTNVSIDRILINGSTAGLVVQDGTTQPWIINSNGEARLIQNYAQWTNDIREYVPKMKQMKYFNGILFGIDATDGRTLLRSVTGRPLDFVVNVDANGNKGGDASTTSYSVGYDPVTCLSALNSGELFVATEKTCFPVEIDYDRLIFAEPLFKNRKPISVGVVNQFSFIDVLFPEDGSIDYFIIDTDGVRSLGAVVTQRNEGRNALFASRINELLRGVKQNSSSTASIVFDNYSLFAFNTTDFGNCIGVYDNNRKQWVCLDDFNLPAIKQFAVADQSESPTLYAITEEDVYILYGGENYATARVRFKGFTSGQASTEVKLAHVRAVFDGGLEEDNAQVTEIVNNRVKTTLIEDIASYDVDPDAGALDNTIFNFERLSTLGWKVEPEISWGNSSKLMLVEILVDEVTNKVSAGQKLKHYNRSL